MKKQINLVVYFLLIFGGIIYAQTTIQGGDVSGIWTLASSPYYIDGDITIPNDSTLIIEPGVLVEFQDHYALYVQGRLFAVGTATDTIVFTINDTTGFSNINIPDGSWHGIRFIDTPVNNDSSMIVYCKLQYGKANGYNPASAGSGGVIYVGNFSKLCISNSTICNSAAFVGGGLAFEDNSSGKINNTLISNNRAALWGGGLNCITSNPVIENVTIERNSASSGGGISCSYSSNPSLVNVIVSNNSADIHAGGIFCSFGSNPYLLDVLISNNSATYGAGINCRDNSSPYLTNVAIVKNIAQTSAGGISCGNNSIPDLINVTISNNRADYWGGAFYCYDSHPRLVNSILWNNPPEEIYFSDYSGYTNSIMIAYSDIQDGENGIVTNNNATVYWLDGNLDTYPVFVDTANGDFRLQEGSPCIDSGVQDTVLVYNNGQDTLIVQALSYLGYSPDMGAYEFDPAIVIKNSIDLPIQYSLYQNFPNPFNPTTTINYSIPASSFVTLKVYDVLGNEITALVNEEKPAGEYNVEFRIDNLELSSGIYFYRLQAVPTGRQAGSFVETKKMV